MSSKNSGRQQRPATTPEARENQLISMAFDTAEAQFREGTASAQVTTHFLKLASTRERLEQERLMNENLLLTAKIEQIRTQEDTQLLYAEALNAMREYQGHDPVAEYDDEY